ncbi:hypothetical protein [Listeria costaricensis]|uniref:hypothetical protein n=1 Tax=Listeria costaricensis TaxID=2026604 RepID=UPI000C07D77A|nr:hypothetical protein [Listeria costaricensis]
MDRNAHQIEQALLTNRREQNQAKEELEQIRREQNEQEWLEVDFKQMQQEEQALMELLRDGWQGGTATGFHYYLEDVQEEEHREWRKAIREKEETLNQQVDRARNKLYDLEDQQRKLQKEITS